MEAANVPARTKLLQAHGLILLRRMLLIREFDARAGELLASGEIMGEIHQYIGQEAVAVGVLAGAGAEALVGSTHRGHGHLLARGCAPRPMMAELYGKASGYCKGKGGSMHITSLEHGMLGANAILGASAAIAVGAAFAEKTTQSSRVAVAFFGDGAANQGVLHESMNLAAVWKLPVLFVCENNQYAISLRADHGLSVRDVSSRAAAYGFDGRSVDGMDVLTVYEATCEALRRMRTSSLPFLLEAKTYRYHGHFSAEAAILKHPYRPEDEESVWQRRDPIARLRGELLAHGFVPQEELDALHGDVRAEVEDAVVFARQSPPPSADEAFTDVYATEVAGLPDGVR